MEVRKVEWAKPPAYPDREASLRDPSLLMNTPERWKRNAAACAALAATSAMFLAACSKGKPPQPPVFIHGKGFASFGGIINRGGPLMPEQLAMDIILDEAGRQGLEFSGESITLDGVVLQIEGQVKNEKKKIILEYEDDNKLTLDGMDSKNKIGFEYVSSTDIYNINVIDSDGISIRFGRSNGSSVSSCPSRAIARMLSEGISATQPDMTVAVFYDPTTGIEDDLRAQVRDFIRWLKAQGII
jgi:hypothetical protein